MTIISYGGIGPPRDFHRGYHPYDAGFAALPDTMPKGETNWDRMCGATGWEVVYKNGDHRYYTGCNGKGFPDALQPASCEFAGFHPAAKPATPSCGPPVTSR